MQVDGLDVNKGVSYYGGDFDTYFKLLEGICREGKEKVNKTKSSLVADDLSQFTYCIHSVKNSCLMVGADGLSKSAEILEKAGGKNDAGYVMENIETFLNDYESLLFNINEALSDEKLKKNEATTDIAIIKDYLVKFKTALTELNMSEILLISENLKHVKCEPETDKIIKDILHMRQTGDYNKSLSLADELIIKLNNQ